jgi:predicted NAD/FAD-binding protein
MSPARVAVIGSGVAGLAAARALSRGGAGVTLFEAAPRAGGHVYTVDAPGRDGPVAVDMGFIVMNRDNYPRFAQLLDELGVATRPTSMSFSVSAGGLEWGSSSLGALFAQRARLRSPRHWRFLAAVLAFLRAGRRDLGGELARRATLDEYLAARAVPADVRALFVIPLAAALWSLAPARCGDFPAESYLRFLHNHGMLRPLRPLDWRTILGGSRRYVELLLAELHADVRLATPVARVARDARGVTIVTGGAEHRFDRAVIATHADRALALLGDGATDDERRVLGAFRYSRNETVLHRDERFLPQAAAARASWNVVADADPTRCAVTYSMNRLMGLDPAEPYLVTLNPGHAPDGVIHRAVFEHPQFDRAALAALAELPRLSGAARVYFAGSYAGFGFHEDGMRAGLAAAARAAADAQLAGEAA